jgi:hypothetical protein
MLSSVSLSVMVDSPCLEIAKLVKVVNSSF